MSHTTTLETKIRDKEALKRAVETMRRELGLEVYIEETNSVNLFQGKVSVKNGIAVKLPNWKYPVLIDLDTGKIYYDNYGGRWGDEKYLNLLKQIYASQKILKAIEKQYGTKVAKKVKKQLSEQLKMIRNKPQKIRLEVSL